MPNKQSSLLSFFGNKSNAPSPPPKPQVRSKKAGKTKDPPLEKEASIKTRRGRGKGKHGVRSTKGADREQISETLPNEEILKDGLISESNGQTYGKSPAAVEQSAANVGTIAAVKNEDTTAPHTKEHRGKREKKDTNDKSRSEQLPKPSPNLNGRQGEINNVISDSESSSQNDSEQKRSLENNHSCKVLPIDPCEESKDADIKDTGTVDPDGFRELSDYEKLRLRNIQRNQERLAKLGLLTPAFRQEKEQVVVRKKTMRKRKKNEQTFTSTPLRRSTRRRSELVESGTVPNITNEVDQSCQIQENEQVEPETFEASPITQYIMDIENRSGNSDHYQTTEKDCRWNELRPTGKLTQDRDAALYSLDIFEDESAFACQWVVGAGKAGIIALWNFTDINEDKEVLPILSWKGHNGRWVADARFLPEFDCQKHPSRLLTAANDGRVCLWDLSSSSCNTGVPKCLSTTGKMLHSSGIFSMDVAAGEAHNDVLVCTGSKDKTISLTPLESILKGGECAPLFRSEFHNGKVGCVEMQKGSNKVIASASDDGFIALHDYTSNKVVSELDNAHQRPHSVTWHPTRNNIFMTGKWMFHPLRNHL